MKLTEHFTLDEMTRSATARRLGIDNTPDAACVERLRQLCIHVLEPLRRQFGPLVVSSGYRCEALNRAVGGAARSQHLAGEAADIKTGSMGEARRLYDYAAAHLAFDQLLLEHRRRTGTCWLHVSFTRRRANRRMARLLEL